MRRIAALFSSVAPKEHGSSYIVRKKSELSEKVKIGSTSHDSFVKKLPAPELAPNPVTANAFLLPSQNKLNVWKTEKIVEPK